MEEVRKRMKSKEIEILSVSALRKHDGKTEERT
jgi:hypothetical protein